MTLVQFKPSPMSKMSNMIHVPFSILDKFTMAWKPIHFGLAGMMVVFGKFDMFEVYVLNV